MILAEQIEQIRSRMEGIAKSEGRPVAELAEASKRADEKLRNEVAELAEDHMARRGAILEGLQALAVRLGAFPQQLEQLTEERAPPKLQSHQTIPLNLSVRVCGDQRNEILDREINNHLRRRSAR
jgi:predicted house-cleaning noncanonical NTP pyrophosphatase (MazG superfamily)